MRTLASQCPTRRPNLHSRTLRTALDVAVKVELELMTTREAHAIAAEADAACYLRLRPLHSGNLLRTAKLSGMRTYNSLPIGG